MNDIVRYFDLSSRRKKMGNAPPAEPPAKPPVIPQYAALAAGVIAEPFIHEYIKSQTYSLSWTGAGQLVVFGLVMAVIIFPAVYRNAFDPERPLFVQLCAIFAAGIGWQSLFQAGKEATIG